MQSLNSSVLSDCSFPIKIRQHLLAKLSLVRPKEQILYMKMSRLVIGKTLPVKDVGEIYIRIVLAYARYAFLGIRAVLPPLFMWMVYSNAFYTGSFLSIV